MNFKAKKYDSTSLNRIVADKSHRVTLAYSPFRGFWQSFVTTGSCNHFLKVTSTYVVNTKKVRSREDTDYSNATIKYGV